MILSIMAEFKYVSSNIIQKIVKQEVEVTRILNRIDGQTYKNYQGNTYKKNKMVDQIDTKNQNEVGM